MLGCSTSGGGELAAKLVGYVGMNPGFGPQNGRATRWMVSIGQFSGPLPIAGRNPQEMVYRGHYLSC